MSADTRFHGTVRRWKQNGRRYELAVLFTVILCGLAAYYGIVNWGDGPVAVVMDWLETREAEPLVEEAERLRLERLRHKVEELRAKAEGLRRAVMMQFLGEEAWRERGNPRSASLLWLICDTLADARERLRLGSDEYAALGHFVRTGDPAKCARCREKLDEVHRGNCRFQCTLEGLVPVLLGELTRPQESRDAARRLPLLHRSINFRRAELVTFAARRAIFLTLLEVVRRYRMWLDHDVWWLPIA